MFSRKHKTLRVGKKAPAGIFFFLVTAVFVIALAAYAQQEVGFVVNLQGTWLLDNSSHRLNAGSPLRAGDTIRVSNPGYGDFIEIADLSGRITHQVSCAKGECRRSIKLKATQSSIVSRVLRALMTIVNKDPKSHRVLIARGEGELRESVVRIAGEQVELSYVLAALRGGSYLLRFEPMRAGAPTIGPIQVNWSPGSPAPVTVKGLNPGLYVVRLLKNDDREPREPGTEAWVLFTRPESFDKNFNEFKEAVALTEGWGKSARVSSKRQLLRAALTNLQDETR